MNVTENDEKTFCDMENVHVCDIEISVIHGKALLRQSAFHQKYKRSHIENECSTYLQNWCPNKMRSMYGVKTIDREDYPWKNLSLTGDEQVISLQRTKVYVFSDSVLCLGKIHEIHPIKRCMGTKIGLVQNISGIQKLGQNWRRANGIRVEYFPGYNTLQLSQEVKSLQLRLDETPENFTGRIIFMSMFNDISCGSRDNEKNASQILISICKEIWHRTMVISWSCFREKSCILSVQIVHKVNGTESQRK